MKKNWIDFKTLRARLDFAQVMEHYGVEVKRKGDQHMGYCPLPNHNGKRNSPSFSANLEKGIFQCFGCGAKGNVLDFAALMEKTEPKDGATLHEVALKLRQRFTQHGRPSVVATMGSDCSERQTELIVSLVKPDGRVWIAPDGDKAGERHAQTLLTLISPHRAVRWLKLADGKQPTDLSAGQLKISFTA